METVNRQTDGGMYGRTCSEVTDKLRERQVDRQKDQLVGRRTIGQVVQTDRQMGRRMKERLTLNSRQTDNSKTDNER